MHHRMFACSIGLKTIITSINETSGEAIATRLVTALVQGEQRAHVRYIHAMSAPCVTMSSSAHVHVISISRHIHRSSHLHRPSHRSILSRPIARRHHTFRHTSHLCRTSRNDTHTHTHTHTHAHTHMSHLCRTSRNDRFERLQTVFP